MGADISMTAYAFTGKAWSTQGPDHSAAFWLGTTYQGTFSWPACRSHRRNWFAGSKKNYPVTVDSESKRQTCPHKSPSAHLARTSGAWRPRSCAPKLQPHL